MKKNLDGHGRWRRKTIAFRVSEEEARQIGTLVRLSGMSKQDYITARLQNREFVVYGNAKVYREMRTLMAEIYAQLLRLRKCSDQQEELLITIQMITEMITGWKGEA
ncbi:MAG: mobilization protein [Lachnospiraceae bacterium]|nr:mobilization protein [Lachnospiraceae bacterium]